MKIGFDTKLSNDIGEQHSPARIIKPRNATMSADSSGSGTASRIVLGVAVGAAAYYAYRSYYATPAAPKEPAPAAKERSLSEEGTAQFGGEIDGLRSVAQDVFEQAQRKVVLVPNDKENGDAPVNRAKELEAVSLAEELESVLREQQMNGGDDAKNAQTFGQSQEDMFEMQRKATIDMARLQAGGNVGQDGKGGMKNLTADECGGTTQTYKWKQTEEEIVVEFPIHRDVRAKQVAVSFKAKHLSVKVKPSVPGEETRVVLEGPTLRDIKPDDCMWEIDDEDGTKKCVVTLVKRHATLAMHHWECVVQGDETIDTSKFGPAVVGINGNDPRALKRMLEEHGHMNPKPVPLEGN